MVLNLIKLQWKGFFRSANMGKNLAIKIFMGFMAIYFGASFLLFGIALYPIIKEELSIQNPMEVVNKYIAIWLLFEIILRYLLQPLPLMNIKPLLVLNITKNSLVHYILIRSILSFFNILAPFIFIPFGVWCFMEGDYSIIQILGWWFALLFLTLCINNINFLLNLKFSENIRGFLIFISPIFILIVLERLDIFSISDFIGNYMSLLLNYPILSILPLLIYIIIYNINFRNLRQAFYLDSVFRGKDYHVKLSNLSWTHRFGGIAHFLQLDIRLILRNKRAKGLLWICLIFTCYGLFFYPQFNNEVSIIQPLVGLFMTGAFMITFGQYIPAWDSGYYPLLMTQNFSIASYLKSKIGLMYFSIGVMSILTIPYVYFGLKILLINLACAIYNAGINVPIILFFGAFNKKRIELDKSPFMNMQGVGASQWLVGIPLLIAPLILFYLMMQFLDYKIATLVLALFGVVGLILRHTITSVIFQMYLTKKHEMIAGYKQVT